ncbi:membrane protein [Streptomyces echinoruber]|uniref:Membrane protein n=1 Tax=Streptomyces echinoruber TaxID=68898 RepID=A0A918RVY5_9ACTN|nr:membrane protein [Streptomyces echinoruber]
MTDTRGPQTRQQAAEAGPAAQPAAAPVAEGAQPQQQTPPPAEAPQTPLPLPGERKPEQPAGPYRPPQAYPSPAPADAVRRPRTGARTTPRTRKARLRVARTDPWSVMKVSFLLSLALGICTVVAAALLWMVLDAMGVFSTVGGTVSEATGSNESNGFDLQAFLSLPHVLIFTSVIAVIDVILLTALATLGSFIYNLSAGFVGGIEVTLAEDE